MISDWLLQAITDFGDSEVLSFGTLSACVILAITGERRASARLLLTMLTTATIIGLTKIYFLGCGNSYSHALHVYSPSGHAALTTAFCGAIATYAASRRSRLKQAIIWFCALTATLCISASRVLLGYHSLTEIVIGFAVGCISVLLMNRFVILQDRSTPSDHRQLVYLVAGVIVVGIGVHGHHFPAERIIRFVARHLPEYVSACREG